MREALRGIIIKLCLKKIDTKRFIDCDVYRITRKRGRCVVESDNHSLPIFKKKESQ